MHQRLYLCLASFCLPLLCCAQFKQSTADVTSTGPLCSPGIINKTKSRGIEFAYDFTNGGTISPTPDHSQLPPELNHLENIVFKVKFPLILRPDLQVLMGYSHQPETYYLGGDAEVKASVLYDNVDTRRLKSNGIGLYVIKPLNAERYTALRLKVDQNGDYGGWLNFDRRYTSFSANWLYAIKKSDDFEWGFGVGFSSDFRRTLAIPFIIYNRNFNNNWGIESIFPAVTKFRFNLCNKTIMTAGYEFRGEAYSIDLDNPSTGSSDIYHLNHSEIRSGVTLERRIVPWVWADVQVGYQFNFDTRIDATRADIPNYEIDPENGVYFKIGLFISPPADFKR